MPQTTAKPLRTNLLKDVKTADDFRKLLDTINNDLARVFDRWMLLSRLHDAHRGPYLAAFTQAPSFWWMVRGSLQDAVMFGLCRAYDDHKDDALTLRSVIEALMRKPAFLKALPSIEDSRLDADLRSVERRTSDGVANLLMWRDKFYAHRDAGKLVNGWTLGDKYPVNVNFLLENAFRIVNGYSATIFNVVNSKEIAAADDYVTVLRAVKADFDAQLDKTRRQVEHGVNGEDHDPVNNR